MGFFNKKFQKKSLSDFSKKLIYWAIHNRLEFYKTIVEKDDQKVIEIDSKLDSLYNKFYGI
jgi:hypothetical protein